MKPTKRRTTPVRPNIKHGLSTLKKAVKELGNRSIDPRTKVGRALKQWKSEIIQDLGGPDNISAQQAELVSLAVTTKLLLDSVTVWLLRQPSIVNKRNRTLYPVVLQRQTLADALCRYLDKLGLERKAKKIPSIQDYINQSGSNPS